jgi:hypothetical protein
MEIIQSPVYPLKVYTPPIWWELPSRKRPVPVVVAITIAYKECGEEHS